MKISTVANPPHKQVWFPRRNAGLFGHRHHQETTDLFFMGKDYRCVQLVATMRPQDSLLRLKKGLRIPLPR